MLVATGHHGGPNLPSFPRLDTFKGKVSIVSLAIIVIDPDEDGNENEVDDYDNEDDDDKVILKIRNEAKDKNEAQ